MKVMIMGVSGSGKSVVGQALAQALHLPFIDADDLHPTHNRDKMAAGQPLDDADRWPWLDRVGAAMAGDAVLACSALKRAYRDRLRQAIAGPLHIVHLTAPRDVLRARLAGRKGHFMPPSLLDSQLATLEPPTPDEALTLSAELPVAALVAQITATLGHSAG